MITDAASAHRFFSADCFNKAWELLEKKDRTTQEQAMLLHLCHASLWHWTQRQDLEPRNLSIGYWQLSRAYAVLGDGANARRFGELCLNHSFAEPPFYIAYAHEAIARAAKVNADRTAWSAHLAEAKRLMPDVTNSDERAMLEKDLADVAGEQH